MMSRENKGKLSFLAGFLSTLLGLIVITRWAGPLWSALLLILLIVIALTLFLCWVYFRCRPPASPPVQREFDWNPKNQ